MKAGDVHQKATLTATARKRGAQSRNEESSDEDSKTRRGEVAAEASGILGQLAGIKGKGKIDLTRARQRSRKLAESSHSSEETTITGTFEVIVGGIEVKLED